MKKYLLLRNNQESGPRSIEQLASVGLFPLDLIWIENESTAWKHPDEIEELKHLISYSNTAQHRLQEKSDKIFVSLPANFSKKCRSEMEEEYASLPVNEMEPVLETNYVRPLEELKENYRVSNHKKPIWNKKIFQSSGGASVLAIFMGVVLGAIMIKKMVDGHVSTLKEQTTAIPIIDREVERQPENIKNAIVKEIVPVYKNVPVKNSKKTNIKKQLKIKTNNYKVGLFGGINGLQLTVFNTSPQFVDKVVVVLDYLKPNGEVVQSENVSFSSIKPLGAQTIAIPGSNRGVKVQYKILKVSAHNYKPDEKEI